MNKLSFGVLRYTSNGESLGTLGNGLWLKAWGDVLMYVYIYIGCGRCSNMVLDVLGYSKKNSYSKVPICFVQLPCSWGWIRCSQNWLDQPFSYTNHGVSVDKNMEIWARKEWRSNQASKHVNILTKKKWTSTVVNPQQHVNIRAAAPAAEEEKYGFWI